ncbi:general odorant-binding protein 56h-like isoform X1 [Lycorma delicatula]|uniref:general odorant-binding protein 56h-like isoform X1 n=1 Tax=Lycorma delicatula TaxID=130591 RepID=UPI003F513B1A
MKFQVICSIILCLISCAVAGPALVDVTSEERTRIIQITEDCFFSNNVTLDEFKHYVSGAGVPADHKLKCFENCQLEKVGIMSDGTYNMEYLKENINNNLADEEKKKQAGELISSCGSGLNDIEDVCDKGSQVFTCFRTNKDIMSSIIQ